MKGQNHWMYPVDQARNDFYNAAVMAIADVSKIAKAEEAIRDAFNCFERNTDDDVKYDMVFGVRNCYHVQTCRDNFLRGLKELRNSVAIYDHPGTRNAVKFLKKLRRDYFNVL